MSSQITRVRKGAGADTGNAGHFASVTYVDSVGTDADLDGGLDLDFLEDVDKPVPNGFGIDTSKSDESDPMVGAMRSSELYSYMSEKSRGLLARHPDLDESMLHSEAIISYLSAISPVDSKGQEKPVSPIAHDPVKARGWLYNTMKTVAMRESTGTAPHDMKGWRVLNQLITEEENATGSHPSADRVDELAEQARLSFPARRRPRVGFHKNVRESSMDVGAHDEGSGFSVIHEAERRLREERENGVSVDFDEGSLGAELSDSLEAAESLAQKRSARSEAARKVWDVMRSSTSAPPIPAGRISAERAGELRSQMESAGGMAAAQKAWDSADDDHPAVALAFEPFGGDDLDPDDKNAIMDTFATQPAYADSLYESALTVASKED